MTRPLDPITEASQQRIERKYARLAGFLMLWLIFNGLIASLLLSRIAPSGTLAETARRIAASEHLYRAALSSLVIENLSGGLLAFALYATLRAVNNLMALLATICNLADSILGLVVRMFGFVRVHLYTSPQFTASGTQSLVDLTRIMGNVMENIGGICFGIGTLLFFYLFWKSRYVPRVLSVLGLSASGIWVLSYLATLVFPELRTFFQYLCFPLMAVAEVTTGFYLALFAVRNQGSREQRVNEHAREATL